MVETMSKFGVPLGEGLGRGGLLQPKYKYRFRVIVNNFGPISGGIQLTQQVQSVSKPKLTQEPIAVHSYNSVAYYAGKHSWGEIELAVKDDVTNSVSALIGYQVQKQLNHLEQTGPMAGQNYKFNMYIEVLDGGDTVVLEQWYLEGCFLQNVDYQDLDYSVSEFQQIRMTIRCDNATQTGGLFPDNPEFFPGSNLTG